MRKYSQDLINKIIKLHLNDGRSISSLTKEYNLGKGTLVSWLKKRRSEEINNSELASESELFNENLRLKKELAEANKENAFLKKAAAFFAKEIE